MSLGAWGNESWDYCEPVAITEMLFRMPKPITRGLVVNMPAGGMSFHSRLYQARMWRGYAMTWHGYNTPSGVNQKWCEQIGRWTYAECKRRARVNLYLAHRLRRSVSLPQAQGGGE